MPWLACDYIVKPFNAEEVLKAVKKPYRQYENSLNITTYMRNLNSQFWNLCFTQRALVKN